MRALEVLRFGTVGVAPGRRFLVAVVVVMMTMRVAMAVLMIMGVLMSMTVIVSVTMNVPMRAALGMIVGIVRVTVSAGVPPRPQQVEERATLDP